MCKPKSLSIKPILFPFVLLTLLTTSCSSPSKPEDSTKEDAQILTQTPEQMLLTTGPKVFYHNYDADKGIETAEEMSQDETLKLLKELPETDGNFLGLALSNGDVVQFLYDGNKKSWYMDIPNAEDGPYDADMSMDQCVQTIKDVYAGKTAEQIIDAKGK